MASMNEDRAIVADGLACTFGRLRALDGLDLAVRRGEVLGLVGPNGAGKTTFIRAVAGLVPPSEGRLRVLGEPPGRYEDLTVFENVEFFGRIYGLSRPTARQRADELFHLLRLSDKTDTPVRSLSGGQRQLTNLAAAMIHGPQLLLLDEPTVGIDPELRRTLWEHFRSLNAAGTTILVTTHVMDEAEHCDRVALIAAGRTIATGSASELRDRSGARSLEDAYLSLRDHPDQEQTS
jgi:ABC-2 type transport system ATP-binding protein